MQTTLNHLTLCDPPSVPTHSAPARRRFLTHSGGLTLSAAAVSLLANAPSGAWAQGTMMGAEADVKILNVALGLEHEAVNAYQIGAGSGLLQKPVLDIAVLFQSHHKAHRDALASTIQKLGGTPVAEKSMDEYLRALNASSIKSQADILDLAARLELGATNAYLGVLPSFKDNKLGAVAARLAADETMHWTVLSQALGRGLPTKALSFGG